MSTKEKVLQYLETTGKSRYWLAMKCKGKVGPVSIYRWLAGKSDLSSSKADIVMEIIEQEKII